MFGFVKVRFATVKRFKCPRFERKPLDEAKQTDWLSVLTQSVIESVDRLVSQWIS